MLAVNQVQSLGIVADDPEEQIETWSEKEIAKVSRGSVRVRAGLTKADGVEYFGPAHQNILLNSAKEAGFTAVEAQGLFDTALMEKKSLGGIKALENFYKALDAKRAEKEAALALEIKTLTDQVTKLTSAPAPNSDASVTVSPLDAKLAELNKLIEEFKALKQTATSTTTEPKSIEDRVKAVEVRLDDEKTGLGATYNLAQSTSDRLDQMDKVWGETVEETNAAIRQIDKKVIVVNAKAENLAVAQTYLSSPDGKERKKGLGLLYLARNGKFRTKNREDAAKYSAGLTLPNTVDQSVDISKEVLPEETKDSTPSGEKKCE